MSSKTKNKRKGIDIFLRVRPSKKSSNYWKIQDNQKVSFDVPIDSETTSRNKQSSHKFQFNHVLPMNAQQDEVFALVAATPITSVMDGFNATIFAYGQTGSGKTWTITGGPERYVDRGIIPRALSMMFEQLKERSGAQFQIHISYLEIYNNTGYDLLDPSHETKRLEDLPKVTMREDEEGQVHLRGLSTHLANSEEEALNLLFLGDTNRAIAETPMNMASSRSHCIFTVFVESREAGSDVIRRSKLHLVDLAGSERVHKTNSSGSILREAQHINQSLHFLEVVSLLLLLLRGTLFGTVCFLFFFSLLLRLACSPALTRFPCTW
jgi:kinesin family protein 6/9